MTLSPHNKKCPVFSHYILYGPGSLTASFFLPEISVFSLPHRCPDIFCSFSYFPIQHQYTPKFLLLPCTIDLIDMLQGWGQRKYLGRATNMKRHGKEHLISWGQMAPRPDWTSADKSMAKCLRASFQKWWLWILVNFLRDALCCHMKLGGGIPVRTSSCLVFPDFIVPLIVLIPST